MADDTETLRQVADRLAIAQLLARYCRGIDRCDAEVLGGVWWPGAIADYGQGPVDARAWSEQTVAALSGLARTQHFIGNQIVDLHGDWAEAETYCRAWHETRPGSDAVGDPGTQFEVGGRYLDRLEKRDGAWRIAHRRYVMDWNRNMPSTAIWDAGLYATLTRVSARKPDDALYTGE